jgi:hypothetical protein
MKLLSKEEILKIRAKYPSFMKAKEVIVKPKKKKVKKIKEHRICSHWCPLGKHEWEHILPEKETGTLDEWKLSCGPCKKAAKLSNIKSISSEKPTAEVASPAAR